MGERKRGRKRERGRQRERDRERETERERQIGMSALPNESGKETYIAEVNFVKKFQVFKYFEKSVLTSLTLNFLYYSRNCDIGEIDYVT